MIFSRLRWVFFALYSGTLKDFVWLNSCSDASFGYPGGPLLFKNLNFGLDLDSRLASKHHSSLSADNTYHMCQLCMLCLGRCFYAKEGQSFRSKRIFFSSDP